MFAIIDGLPYLIHNGMAIPVEIKENGDYSYDVKKAAESDAKGVYTVREILAKCDKLSSVPKAKATKKPRE